MNEDEIVAKLKENIKTDEPQVVVSDDQKPSNTAMDAVRIDFDEVTLYKLHEFFGEQFSPMNSVSNKRLGYIFEIIAQDIGTSDYGSVLSKIREIEQQIGTSHESNRLYRLYQWLKLDGVRRKVNEEMGALYA